MPLLCPLGISKHQKSTLQFRGGGPAEESRYEFALSLLPSSGDLLKFFDPGDHLENFSRM